MCQGCYYGIPKNYDRTSSIKLYWEQAMCLFSVLLNNSYLTSLQNCGFVCDKNKQTNCSTHEVINYVHYQNDLSVVFAFTISVSVLVWFCSGYVWELSWRITGYGFTEW